jgi:excisionase family DNA binding protein
VSEEWLTVADIVRKLRVHEQTVRRWLRSGALPGRNLGGKAGWRVRSSDLDRFLGSQAGGGSRSPAPMDTTPNGGQEAR